MSCEAWTYNGMVPAPSIHLEVGDKVEFRLTNDLPIATDLHLHGLNVDNAFDGVAPLTQDLIEPGDTFTYEYTADEVAVAMYHPHVHSQIAPQRHVRHDPRRRGAPPARPDHRRSRLPADLPDHPGDPDGAQRRRRHRLLASTARASRPPHRSPPSSATGCCSTTSTRAPRSIRCTCTSSTRSCVAKDGYPLDAPYTVDTLNVAPGERYSVLVQLDQPGAWVWHCHILPHVEDESGHVRHGHRRHRRVAGTKVPPIRPERLCRSTAERRSMQAMTTSLDVLMIESDPGIASGPATDLLEAGHRLHWAHDRRPRFRCRTHGPLRGQHPITDSGLLAASAIRGDDVRMPCSTPTVRGSTSSWSCTRRGVEARESARRSGPGRGAPLGRTYGRVDVQITTFLHPALRPTPAGRLSRDDGLRSRAARPLARRVSSVGGDRRHLLDPAGRRRISRPHQRQAVRGGRQRSYGKARTRRSLPLRSRGLAPEGRVRLVDGTRG